MKHTSKRLSVLLLAVCLLLSMAVPAVWAEDTSADAAQTVTYNFYYGLEHSPNLSYAKWNQNKEILEKAYADKTINSMPLYYSRESETVTLSLLDTCITASPCYVNDYVAIKLQSPGAGTYSMSFTHVRNSQNARECYVYVLPGATAESAISDGSALTNTALVGTVDMTSKTLTNAVGTIQFALEAGTEYIVVFKAVTASSSGNANFRLASMELTKTQASSGSGGSAGSDVIVPDSGSFTPVNAQIAAENAISTGTLERIETWVNPQNGHTYMYLMYKGGLIIVYDLNTKEIIDTEQVESTQVRATYVDANGIMWFIGATRYLYWYDPYAMTYDRIHLAGLEGLNDISSFSGFGITGDESGNLYFGTYNKAYLVKYDPNTKVFTNLMGQVDPDVSYSGFGGLIVQDGYIYADIRGDANNDTIKTHQIIKFDIEKGEIVGRVDISECYANDADAYIKYLTMVDGVLIGNTTSKLAKPITVDAETMQLIEVEGLENGLYGYVSEPIGDKVYFFGYTDSDTGSKARCLFEYDGAKATPIPEIPYTSGLTTNNVITIDGNDDLPGPSIMLYKNGAAGISVYLCNLETKQIVHYVDVVGGSGNPLRTVISDPSGENLYVTAFGVNPISQYNIAAGAVTKQMAVYDHQSDGLYWYNGYLYAGSYGAGCITRVDVETGAVTPLFRLDATAFRQERMFAMAAGDGKVFCGTVPCKGRVGGVIVWYDLEKKLTYVAAGPNPEDVYYAKTYDWEAGALLGSYTWYSATDGKVMDFDDDNDGAEDYNITVNGTQQQRFYGTINNQTVKKLVYQNGYLYGITTTNGGSETPYTEDNALLFVYDVTAMKVIATCDLSTAIEGLPTPVRHIDALAADPDAAGKFWGVISDTLFSCTFDAETATFSIQEELSLGKSQYAGGSTWFSRDILFDGDYMYVAFASCANAITMVNKTTPKEYFILSYVDPDPCRMALGSDDNLYFIQTTSNNLMVLKIADQTAAIKDPSEVAAVQAKINALDDAANITLEDEAAILAARAAYEKLTEAGKALVKAEKLTAAEVALAAQKAAAEKEAADKAAADAATYEIEAIGEVTLESEEAIKAARKAYDALTEEQKPLVTNLDTLTAAEAKLSELKAAADKAADDKAAADDAAAKIKAIGTVTLNSEEAIKAARAAYEALTADQKKLVDTTKLTAAEAKLAELKLQAEQEAADKAAADAATTKIEAIGTVTLESKEAINAAREAYDALTVEQKALVSNLDALTAAENKLAELQAAAADAERIEAARDVVGKALAAMTVTNETSKEAIQKTIDEALKKAGITDVEAAVTNVAVTAATTEKAGAATITVVIASGKGSESTNHTKTIAKLIPPADPENPQTGDNANLILPVVLMVVSVMGIAAVVICAQKFSYKGKHLK